MYLLAHDLGTTGNKATLFDTNGKLVASALETYPTYYDRPGWVEQDPDSWWQAVCKASAEVMKQAGITKTAIAAMSFSGHMMGCVPVDEQGHALRRAIIWADQRSTAQVAKLLESMTPESIYRITGTRPNPNYTLEKIMWIRDNEPEIYRKTTWVLQSKDYVVARLTGRFATDYSDASATNAYDLANKAWSSEMLAAAAIPGALFPEALPSATVIGPVRHSDGVDLEGVPVVLGGGDGACATVGAGVIRANEGYNYFGSSSWIAIATTEPVFDPQMRTFNLCHLEPHLYMPVGTMQSAGGSYDWIREVLVPEEFGKTADEAYELLNRWAVTSPPCAEGVLFLPYLIGERSPHWNEDARGAFVGLARSHSTGELVRSVIEGVAFNLRIIFEALTEQGAELQSLRMIGGGVRNAVLCQAMADMLGIPIERLESGEFATSLGAAVCAGVGIGVFDDFSVAASLSPIAGIEQPTALRKPLYDQTY
ncbi:FGGY-family carbohydrate kinase, partial [Candidatus Bipolaricaulota bacterium]|nr:FGGY-family carbohydrate kinase [Candidatus Bipolaricaulota bacterium]